MARSTPDLTWQPSLFDDIDEVKADPGFSGLERISLDPDAWVDHVPHWVSGADALFAELLDGKEWGQRSRHMYDGKVQEPRLTWSWRASSGEPLEPVVLDEMRRLLGERYSVRFDSAGLNLYRDGRDSVAWHGDRIDSSIEKPLVALVSVGAPRKFLLRPKGGGRSRSFLLGRGDLLVTGGTTQRTWEHSVPKVAKAEPRISIAFRHNMQPIAYDDQSVNRIS